MAYCVCARRALSRCFIQTVTFDDGIRARFGVVVVLPYSASSTNAYICGCAVRWMSDYQLTLFYSSPYLYLLPCPCGVWLASDPVVVAAPRRKWVDSSVLVRFSARVEAKWLATSGRLRTASSTWMGCCLVSDFLVLYSLWNWLCCIFPLLHLVILFGNSRVLFQWKFHAWTITSLAYISYFKP